MAVNNAAKISNFLSGCVANAAMIKQARDTAKILAEELASDAVLAAIADTDCVGANSHLTRTIVLNYLQGIQPPLEAMLTNGAVATINRMPNLMAMLSGS
jgi:hypothetical protein